MRLSITASVRGVDIVENLSVMAKARCIGSYMLPIAVYQVRVYAYVTQHGECKLCHKLYSINKNGKLFKHRFNPNRTRVMPGYVITSNAKVVYG